MGLLSKEMDTGERGGEREGERERGGKMGNYGHTYTVKGQLPEICVNFFANHCMVYLGHMKIMEKHIFYLFVQGYFCFWTVF